MRKIYSTDHIVVHYDKDFREYVVTPKGYEVGSANSAFPETKGEAVKLAKSMEYSKQYPNAKVKYGRNKAA